jgi:hypothetical protein
VGGGSAFKVATFFRVFAAAGRAHRAAAISAAADLVRVFMASPFLFARMSAGAGRPALPKNSILRAVR